MIVRDKYGIVCQHDITDKSYLDGGDSARATGMMALCDSKQDQKLVASFVVDGKGVRHPMQEHFNNPNNFTRDQLIQLTAGLWASNKHAEARSLLKANYPLCQNTHTTEGTKKAFWNRDIIMPSVLGHLIACGKVEGLYFLLPIFRILLLLDILWSCYVAPKSEQNQIIAMCIVAGPPFIKLYRRLHPDYKASTREYWGNDNPDKPPLFRYQQEIAERIIRKIENT